MAQTATLNDPLDGATVHPDIGSNGPDRETLLFFMGQFQSYEAKLDEAKVFKRTVRSRAKLRGIDLEQFDLAVKQFGLEENTTFDNLKTFKRYCEMLSLPIGSQLQLFDVPGTNGAFSEEALLKKAESSGYDRGVMGLNPDEQAYPPMTPEGQAHMKSWHEGQAINLAKIRQLDEEPEAEPKKRGRPKKEAAEDATVN